MEKVIKPEFFLLTIARFFLVGSMNICDEKVKIKNGKKNPFFAAILKMKYIQTERAKQIC